MIEESRNVLAAPQSATLRLLSPFEAAVCRYHRLLTALLEFVFSSGRLILPSRLSDTVLLVPILSTVILSICELLLMTICEEAV